MISGFEERRIRILQCLLWKSEEEKYIVFLLGGEERKLVGKRDYRLEKLTYITIGKEVVHAFVHSLERSFLPCFFRSFFSSLTHSILVIPQKSARVETGL